VVTGQKNNVRVVALREAVQHLEGGVGGACGASGAAFLGARPVCTTTIAKMQFPLRPPIVSCSIGHTLIRAAHAQLCEVAAT